jgi:hypothetical protein
MGQLARTHDSRFATMSSRLAQITATSPLALMAVFYGLLGYVSFGLNEALVAIARWVSGGPGPGISTTHKWDEWFFLVLCFVSLIAAVGIFFRRRWAKAASLVAFGASGVWAMLVATAPESWRGVWFSTWMDRWAAALLATLSIAGFGWYYSRRTVDLFRISETIS